jgi:hypothetical protein
MVQPLALGGQVIDNAGHNFPCKKIWDYYLNPKMFYLLNHHNQNSTLNCFVIQPEPMDCQIIPFCETIRPSCTSISGRG